MSESSHRNSGTLSAAERDALQAMFERLSGSYYEVLGVARDITQLRQSSDALRDREAQYRAIVSQACRSGNSATPPAGAADGDAGCASGSRALPKFRRGALSRFMMTASPQAGHCTRPRSS